MFTGLHNLDEVLEDASGNTTFFSYDKRNRLKKVLYPDVGFTKAQVIDYYIRIAPVLLPHLHDRPITLKRYPDGVNGFFFYEKQCPSHRPSWIETTQVPSRRKEGKIDYCMMNDLPALVWAANLADLELHTFLHRAPAITMHENKMTATKKKRKTLRIIFLLVLEQG